MGKKNFYTHGMRAACSVSKAYYNMREKCDKVSFLAKGCIDWTDDVRCIFLPGVGTCIQVRGTVVPVSRFFIEADSSEGIVSKDAFERLIT